MIEITGQLVKCSIITLAFLMLTDRPVNAKTPQSEKPDGFCASLFDERRRPMTPFEKEFCGSYHTKPATTDIAFWKFEIRGETALVAEIGDWGTGDRRSRIDVFALICRSAAKAFQNCTQEKIQRSNELGIGDSIADVADVRFSRQSGMIRLIFKCLPPESTVENPDRSLIFYAVDFTYVNEAGQWRMQKNGFRDQKLSCVDRNESGF
jgi:hypothetical protein